MNPKAWVYGLSSLYVLLFCLSIFIPQIAADGHQGLAAAGIAAGFFLMFAGCAVLVSLFLLIYLLMNRNSLSTISLCIGLFPIFLSALGIVVLLGFFIYYPSPPGCPVLDPKPTNPIPSSYFINHFN